MLLFKKKKNQNHFLLKTLELPLISKPVLKLLVEACPHLCEAEA